MKTVMYILFLTMPVVFSYGTDTGIASFGKVKTMKNAISVERQVEQVDIQCFDKRAVMFYSKTDLDLYLSINKIEYGATVLEVRSGKFFDVQQQEQKIKVEVDINDGYSTELLPVDRKR